MYDDNIFEDEVDQEEAARRTAENSSSDSDSRQNFTFGNDQDYNTGNSNSGEYNNTSNTNSGEYNSTCNSNSGEYHYKGAGGTYGSYSEGNSGYGGPQYGGSQYGGPQYGGPQHDGPQYGGFDDGSNGYYYNSNGKRTGNSYGIAALVCGIISLIFFCSCFNIILAILALIFGVIQIKKYNDRAGKGMAIGGIVTGLASVICFCVFWGMLFGGNAKLINSIGDDDLYQYYYEFGQDGDLEDFIERYMEEQDGNSDEIDSIEDFESKKGTTI